MIIDENICDLRGLAITTEKKQDYETPGMYTYDFELQSPRLAKNKNTTFWSLPL